MTKPSELTLSFTFDETAKIMDILAGFGVLDHLKSDNETVAKALKAFLLVLHQQPVLGEIATSFRRRKTRVDR